MNQEQRREISNNRKKAAQSLRMEGYGNKQIALTLKVALGTVIAYLGADNPRTRMNKAEFDARWNALPHEQVLNRIVHLLDRNAGE